MTAYKVGLPLTVIFSKEEAKLLRHAEHLARPPRGHLLPDELNDAEKRARLMEYLKTLSSQPEPGSLADPISRLLLILQQPPGSLCLVGTGTRTCAVTPDGIGLTDRRPADVARASRLGSLLNRGLFCCRRFSEKGLEFCPAALRGGLRLLRFRVNSNRRRWTPASPRRYFYFAQAGIETFESCPGGPGHAYAEPTVRFYGDRSEGFPPAGRGYTSSVAGRRAAAGVSAHQRRRADRPLLGASFRREQGPTDTAKTG